MAKDAKGWTPGPWHAHEGEGGDFCSGAVSAGFTVVAEVCRDRSEVVAANARLLAAAPEMFAALERIAARPVEDGDGFSGNDAEINYLREVVEDLQGIAASALARAGGAA